MFRKSLAAAVLAATVSTTLVSCSNGTDGAGTSGGSGDAGNSAQGSAQGSAADSTAFPATIEHAFGTTTVDKAPQRVATVGWANHEVPLALGIKPVGMSKSTWGDDNNNGIMPWTEDKLRELEGEDPVLFDETDGIPYEQVAGTKPDVILASYSGLTQEDYDTLSKIAPVVAYPEIPWGTSLEDMTEMNAKALGKEKEGEKLLEDLERQTDQALSQHPELKGKKVLFTAFGGASDASKIGFYTEKDPRMGFLTDNGMEAPEIVDEYTDKSEEFWVEVSAEKPEQFKDVDVIVAYSSGDPKADEKTLKDMQADPLKSKIPAINKGNVVFLDNGPLGASANQSPLSIPWGIDKYFAKLAEGVK